MTKLLFEILHKTKSIEVLERKSHQDRKKTKKENKRRKPEQLQKKLSF